MKCYVGFLKGLFAVVLFLSVNNFRAYCAPLPEMLWSHATPTESYWDYKISLGMYGSQIFSDTGWDNGEHSRLYSTFEQSNIAPIWDNSGDAWEVKSRSVASSSESNIHAVFKQEKLLASGGLSFEYRSHLEVYESSSSAPILSYFLSIYHDKLFVDLTPDGRFVAAAIHNGSSTRLIVFDLKAAQLNTPILEANISLYGQITQLGISADGRRINLSSKLRGVIIEVPTGNELFSEYYFDTLEVGHSFSKNGKVLARPTGAGVKVQKEISPGSFVTKEYNPYAWDAPEQAYLTGLSGDGSVVAAAFFTSPDYQKIEVFAWDTDTDTQLLHHVIQGAGTYDNWPSAIKITDDSSKIALASYGDQLGLAPEIHVYEKLGTNLGYILQTSFNRPGSVYDLEISADGNFLATSGRTTHYNAISGTKVVESFSLGGELNIVGLPVAGSTITIEFYPHSATLAKLLVASELAPDSEQYSFGELFLDRPTVDVVSMGNVDGAGKATITFPIPIGTQGQVFYLQGFGVSPQRELSKSFIPITIF